MKYDYLILSSLPLNSGCFLRAKYFADSLRKTGAKVKLIKPVRSKPFMLDFFIHIIKYKFIVFFTRYRTGIAIKPYPNTLLPLLIKKIFCKNKVIVDIDDIDFGYRRGIISFISRLIQKPFPGFCDMVTYHNPLLKKFIMEEYKVSKNKLSVLKQGVDLEVFDYRIDNKIFKKKFISKNKLNKNTGIIIYCAHLNIASDLDVILDNIDKVIKKHDSIFIIAGGGPMLEYYKNYAKDLKLDNIFFTGYLTSQQIVKYALLSDYSLVYYKDKKVNYYRSSMKMREQLALQRKVICNDIGELKMFKKYTYQSTGSIKNYIKLIDKCLSNRPKDKREIEGYKFIRKNYDWLSIGREFHKSMATKF